MSQGLTGAVSGAAARAASTGSAATVTLPAAPLNATYPITGTTTITSITAGAAGAVARLEFVSAACQVTNGSNLKLASNYISTVLGTLTLESDGTNWIELDRNPPRLVTAANLVVAGPASGGTVMETARALVRADAPAYTLWSFVAAYQSTLQSVNSTTFTLVSLQAVASDQLSEFTATGGNYKFTAGVTGLYVVSGGVALSTLADGTRVSLSIYLNGSEVARAIDVTLGAATDTVITGSAPLFLTVGDVIQLYVWHNAGVAKNTITGSSITYMRVVQVH